MKVFSLFQLNNKIKINESHSFVTSLAKHIELGSLSRSVKVCTQHIAGTIAAKGPINCEKKKRFSGSVIEVENLVTKTTTRK